jgi:8-amino-7-oxononanoate synthase
MPASAAFHWALLFAVSLVIGAWSLGIWSKAPPLSEFDFIRETLDELKARTLYRRLVAVGPARLGGSAAGPHIQVGGRTVLQFASNNYLGLAADPRVREAAVRGIEKWGWGAGASRLVSGNTEAHEALERDLAAFKGTEAAVVFATGYMANLGAITALVGRGDVVISDRENHASIYDGVRLSGAELKRYAHADASAAARLLPPHSALRTPHCLLVTDTVFSMGGDLAPLADLSAACRDAGAMLLVDEAHALGLLGPTGAGLVEQLGLLEPAAEAAGYPGMKYPAASAAGSNLAIISVGTLSKALGGVGGFVAGSREVCDLLINKARPLVYSTALPAAACEAAREALRILRSEPDRRRRPMVLADRLRADLHARGFDTGRSATPIVPVIVGDAGRALAMAAALLDRGIFCPAIRPPTVPPHTSRLRISLTADHTEDDLGRLVEALTAARG